MSGVFTHVDFCVDIAMFQPFVYRSNEDLSPTWNSQIHGSKMTCQQSLANPCGSMWVVKGEGKMALGGAINYLDLERRGGSTKYGHSQGQGHAQQRKQHVQRSRGREG